MTQRLPIPGGDDGDWGTILNGFLGVSLNSDGTISSTALATTLPSAGAITSINGLTTSNGAINLKLANLTDTTTATTATNGQVLAYNSTSSTWVPATVSSSTISDATTSAPGLVQLAGDLGGSGTNATAPTLANTSNVQSVVNTIISASSTVTGALQKTNNLSDVSSASGARTNLGLGGAATLSVGTTSGTVAAGNDSRITGAIQSGAMAGGDLSGTLPNPTVSRLQGAVSLSGTPSSGQVLTASSTSAASWVTPTAGGAQALIPTAVKTSAYTANPGDFIPVDTSGGSVTITLPTTPADKTRIEIKMINTTGSNAVTYNAGGSDVFNKGGGATSGTLTLLNQAVMLQYEVSGDTGNSTGIWYVQSDDLPLSQTDERYVLETSVGQASGVASLDSSGLLPVNQLPVAIQSITITGDGAPASGSGLNGDYYLDYTTGSVYFKSSGSWSSSIATLGLTPNVVSIASTYTATSGQVVFANGTFTVTSPAVAAGANVTIENTGTGTITFFPASGLVNGASSFVLTSQYDSFKFICDGTNWGVF